MTNAAKPPRSPRTANLTLNYTPQRTSASTSMPSSMPSSPTSIHSSSSAIFERDIQLPPNATTHSHIRDPHKISRAGQHEATDMSVPSVLTSAVLALEGSDGRAPSRGASHDEISVVAPSPLSPQNWTSHSDSLRPTFSSRSPSPTSGGPSPPRSTARPSLPVRLSSGGPHVPGAFPPVARSASAASSVSASPNRTDNVILPYVSITSEPQPLLPLDLPTPSIIGVVPPTPNANLFHFSSPSPPTTSTPLTPPSGSDAGSPKAVIVHPPTNQPIPRSANGSTTTVSRPSSFIGLSLEDLSLAPLMSTTTDTPIPVPAGAPLGTSIATPPSPSLSGANKRLSFISYNDMLLSTPVSTFTLSSITNPQTNNAPGAEPPHQVVASSRASLVGVAPAGTAHDVFGGVQPALPVRPTHSHDAGGEWIREGFGQGMEERLESALTAIKGN